MVRTEPKYRRPLNTSQLNVLKLLYKFRFADTELLASYGNVSHRRVIFSRINILYQQGYIGRHYDSSYRIDRKKAVYFLLPKGMKALKGLPDFDTTVINSIYKDKIASEQFRARCLNIFTICCKLKAIYGDKIKFCTKSDLVVFDYFPQPPPDAYIKIKLETGDGATKHFFLDYYDLATPFFLHRKRIDRYIKYDEEGDWDVTKTDLPIFLSVSENPTLVKRTLKRMAQAVDDSLYSEAKFYGADLTAITQMETPTDKLWRLAGETKLIPTEEIIEKAV
jgi:hypothetical protein